MAHKNAPKRRLLDCMAGILQTETFDAEMMEAPASNVKKWGICQDGTADPSCWAKSMHASKA